MKYPKTYPAITMLFLLILSGCGGGGSGSDSDSPGEGINDVPVIYSGITERAEISADNIDDFLVATISGGLFNYTAQLINTLFDQEGVAAGSVIEQGSYDCSGGGRLSYNLSVDAVTSVIEGDFNISECAMGAFAQNGNLSIVSGDLLVDTVVLTLQFDNLGIVSRDSNAVVSSSQISTGTIDCAFLLGSSSEDVSCIINAVSRDRLSNTLYRYEELEVFDLFGDRFTGFVYHSSYGYINIEAPGQPVFSVMEPWPQSGQLALFGDNGFAVVDILGAGYTVSLEQDGMVLGSEFYEWP